MSKSSSSESANYMTTLLRSVIVTLSGDDGSSSGLAYDSIDLSDYEEEDEGSGENFATNSTATVHTPLNSAGMIKILNGFLKSDYIYFQCYQWVRPSKYA